MHSFVVVIVIARRKASVYASGTEKNRKFVSTVVHFFTVSCLQTETHRCRFCLRLHFVGDDTFRSPRALLFLISCVIPVTHPRYRK